jgi:hypothetical protein
VIPVASEQCVPTPDDVREMIAFSVIQFSDDFEGTREDAYAIADAALARVRAEAAANAVEEAGNAFVYDGRVRGGALFSRRDIRHALRAMSAELREEAGQ